MTAKRDHRWERILANAPREIMVELVKRQPGHQTSELAKDTESVLDEVFRVCDAATVQALYEDFPGPYNFVIWFFEPTTRVSKGEVQSALKKKQSQALSDGIKPQVTEEPILYKIENTPSNILLRYVASDRNQRLALEFGETETLRVLSYYDCLLHFSDVVGLVFGSPGSNKATEIMREADAELGLNGQWELLKPGRGESREFYQKVKKSLGAFLVETKRQDPAGNYQTITLEARTKQPDLEQVAHFQKHFLAADSYFDVLEFRCNNRLGLLETTHVRFGRPLGRFIFKHGSSLSAVLHFQEKISALLR